MVKRAKPNRGQIGPQNVESSEMRRRGQKSAGKRERARERERERKKEGKRKGGE